MKAASNVIQYKDRRLEEIPALVEDPATQPFVVAAINNVVDKDIVSPKGTIVCLTTLFRTHSLTPEAKRYLLPHLSILANQIGRKLNKETLECLLQNGADPALIFLASNTSLSLLEQLVAAGADVAKYNEKGYSALHAAMVAKEDLTQDKRIAFLLDHHVDPNKVHHPDPSIPHPGGTALHSAIANEGFNNKESQHIAKQLIQEIQKRKLAYNWNLQDNEGKTLLLLAAKMRCTELVTLILETAKAMNAPLNVNLPDKEGRTALHFACAYGDKTSVDLLLQNGANPETADNLQRRPLHYAVFRESLIRRLFESVSIDPERAEGALNNFIVGADRLPIHVASSNDMKKIPLHARQASVSFKEPILMVLAQQAKYPECGYTVDQLKKYDKEFIELQFRGITDRSLLKACMEEHKGVVELLLNKGVQLDARNSNSNTAFDIAKRDRTEASVTPLERQAANAVFELLKPHVERIASKPAAVHLP